MQTKGGGTENHTKIAVFGGLSNLSLEDAQKWLTDELWNAWLPQPIETYCKGDFKGILFARFHTNTDRDDVVGWFRKHSTLIQGTNVWSKPDRFLHERVIQSLVFGTKYLLDKSL